MKHLFILILSLACLVSCTDYDLGYTAEEIAYNSAFAAEFNKPDPNHDWGFINQPIVDYGMSTRVVAVNSNEWGKAMLNIPANEWVWTDSNNGYFKHADGTTGSTPISDVTPAEAEWVYNWFATNQNPDSKAIHWSDFFIRYVNSYNEHEHVSSRNMDQLGYEGIQTSWEHVNNFNTTTHAMQYVYDAGTENWTYRSSFDNKYHNNLYNIQFLSFTASDGKHYEGWYVGFDYEAVVIEGDGSERRGSVHADGYYCDWIVKVSPGYHQGYPTTVRIMCEDLGNSFDWDFNDVVFDVTFVKKNGVLKADIVLRAVGGTLPIYVGTTDERYEAHALLGDGSMTPIIHPEAPAMYSVELNNGDYTSSQTEAQALANSKNIPIYVRGQYATYQIQATDIPQKFACPDWVDWSEECQNIRNKYSKFPDWITDHTMENVWTIELVNE